MVSGENGVQHVSADCSRVVHDFGSHRYGPTVDFLNHHVVRGTPPSPSVLIPPLKFKDLSAEELKGFVTNVDKRDLAARVTVVWSSTHCESGNATYKLWARLPLKVSSDFYGEFTPAASR